MPLDHYREANRANWDARVPIHYGSDEYGIARFISDPAHLSGVVTYDKEKLGDVTGKSLLHLQCHIGTDTISWARLGASVRHRSVIEVDRGRQPSQRGLRHSGEVHRLRALRHEVLDEKFDIVYTGIGGNLLDPGNTGLGRGGVLVPRARGHLLHARGHPMMWAMDWLETEELRVAVAYFETADPEGEEEHETYAGVGVVESPLNYGWNHGSGKHRCPDPGRTANRCVEEYDECEWQGLPMMIQEDDGCGVCPTGGNGCR